MGVELNLTSRHRIGIRAAINIALSDHTNKDFIHGCAILKGARVLSTGFNIIGKTHPDGSGFSNTQHAECRALFALNTDPSGSVCYTVRLNKYGQLAQARPCKDCMQSIQNVNINTIIYTQDNGSWFIEKL